jgi:hypothetical protein
MGQLPEKISARRIVKAVWPAFAVLTATFLISLFVRDSTFITGVRSTWMIVFRFLRLSVFLLLPILFLPRIMALTGSLVQGSPREFVHVQQEHSEEISPLKNWLIRPLQGTGVTMLFATKLIFLLEIYTGGGIDTDTIMHPVSFSLGRFLATAALAVAVSLLLSYLWTLEDLGIRLYNRKTREVMKIGKYFGLILPLALGFYGLMSLSKQHPLTTAILSFIQLALVLYPPFLIFNVFHGLYVTRNVNRLLTLLHVKSKMVL